MGENLDKNLICIKILSVQNLAPGDVTDEALASQPAFTCSKLTIETLEQGVKYVQS